jgi:hypothetical protein
MQLDNAKLYDPEHRAAVSFIKQGPERKENFLAMLFREELRRMRRGIVHFASSAA